MSISAKRASAVRAYLINKHGISGDRLTAKGYGPDFPVKSNGTYAGRLANRRVEAKVRPSKKSLNLAYFRESAYFWSHFEACYFTYIHLNNFCFSS